MNAEPKDRQPPPTLLDEFLLYLASGITVEEAKRLAIEEAKP